MPANLNKVASAVFSRTPSYDQLQQPIARSPSRPVLLHVPDGCEASEKLLQLSRKADQFTDDRRTMTALHAECTTFWSSLERSSPVQPAAHQAVLLIGSYMGGNMQKKKVPIDPQSPIAIAFKLEHERHMPVFLFSCVIGRSLYGKTDEQRTIVNVGADACLVGADGIVGPWRGTQLISEAQYVNAVLTCDSDRLVTIQAQGPKGELQVRKLLDMGINYARLHGCTHVCFVNISLDKIQPFGDAVGERHVDGIQVEYRELEWIDGEVPNTHAKRQFIVNFVRTLGEDLLGREGRTVVIFNCHIGLDRSGITNALTQLFMHYLNCANSLDAGVAVLGNLKRARPHAISTSFRFELIMDCFEDLREAAALLRAA